MTVSLALAGEPLFMTHYRALAPSQKCAVLRDAHVHAHANAHMRVPLNSS